MTNSTKRDKRNLLLARADVSFGVGEWTVDQQGSLGIPSKGREREENMVKDKDLEGLGRLLGDKKQRLADCCVFVVFRVLRAQFIVPNE